MFSRVVSFGSSGINIHTKFGPSARPPACLLRPRLTPHGKLYSAAVNRVREASPGKKDFFPTMHLLHLRREVRVVVGLCLLLQTYPLSCA